MRIRTSWSDVWLVLAMSSMDPCLAPTTSAARRLPCGAIRWTSVNGWLLKISPLGNDGAVQPHAALGDEQSLTSICRPGESAESWKEC